MVKRISLILGILLLLLTYTFAHSFADVSTSATIPPRTANFQFAFNSNDSGTTFPQQQTLTYTITYGASSSAAFSTTTTLTAEFTQDTINGIHVLDYVTGSASNAYQDTPPVVNLTTRTITWNIPSLPAGVMDQKVTFQLKTNSNYSGTTPVNFSVKALMSNQYTSFPEQNVYQTLDPNFKPLSSQQSSIATPTPAPTITPTPSPTVAPTVAINDVFFNTISDTKSEMSIHTSLPAKISVFYGTNYTALSQAFATGDYASYTKAFLTDLKPHTTYFARITAVDQNGNKDTSEIFTFQTAATPPVVSMDKSTAILTSNGSLLSTITQELAQHTGIQTILPNSATYEITYSLPSSTKVKFIDVVLRNKHVLGINTYAYAQESNIIYIPMVEKEQGVYYAQLPPILLSGEYEVYVRVTETTGNIYEQKVSEIKVSLPLTIREKGTDNPIEDARVYFYLYNTRTKKFEPITELYGSIKNPDFSDRNGLVKTVLPSGTYKVEVSSIFHGPTTQQFTLTKGASYPTIYLNKEPFNIMNMLRYIGMGLFDLGSSAHVFILSLAASTRYFNMIALLIIAGTVSITFILFRLKVHIPFKQMPMTLYHHMHHTLLPLQETILFGKVFAPNGIALSSVEVYALTDDEKVLFHTTTNRQGSFSYKRQKGATHFHFLQEGFEQLNMPIADEANIKIVLTQNPDFSGGTQHIIVKSLEKVGGLFFETFLILSLLLECTFLDYFGILQTLPFLVLSLGNILLWVFYMRDGMKRE